MDDDKSRTTQQNYKNTRNDNEKLSVDGASRMRPVVGNRNKPTNDQNKK